MCVCECDCVCVCVCVCARAKGREQRPVASTNAPLCLVVLQLRRRRCNHVVLQWHGRARHVEVREGDEVCECTQTTRVDEELDVLLVAQQNGQELEKPIPLHVVLAPEKERSRERVNRKRVWLM